MDDLPLHVLDAPAFQALRDLLTGHGFTDAGICARCGVATVFDYGTRAKAGDPGAPRDGLDLLLRLFMDSEAVDEADLRAHLRAADIELLAAFGLLGPGSDDASRWAAPVRLYPTRGVWIVSDRDGPPGDEARPDMVYPVLTGSGRSFVEVVPTGPVARYLELCSGTGIAALLGAAAGAEAAWAVDITARATAFADFNARLNGLPQFTALEGDLWAPVAGLTFDVVAAHPPYVPAARPELIYRDGGADGEQVTRAVLAGLPRHLAPGGVLQCTCVVSARRGRGAPRRVREFLGEEHEAFDLVFMHNDRFDFTRRFRAQLLSDDPEVAAAGAALLRRFDELEIEAGHFCTLALRRHGEARPGFTAEVKRGPRTRWADLVWALDVGAAAADEAGFAARLLDAPVALAPAATFELTYRRGSAGEDPWVPSGGRIRVQHPFPSSVAVGAADAAILAEFDGSRTLRQHLTALQADGRVPPQGDPALFARAFAPMVLAGIVDSGVAPLPAAPDP